jgi:hypothetical protein
MSTDQQTLTGETLAREPHLMKRVPPQIRHQDALGVDHPREFYCHRCNRRVTIALDDDDTDGWADYAYGHAADCRHSIAGGRDD